MKELLGRLLCKLGWHDWKRVPGEWREIRLGLKSHTNALCQRCPARADINWPLSEEEVEEAAQRLLEAGLWDSYRIFRKYYPEKTR